MKNWNVLCIYLYNSSSLIWIFIYDFFFQGLLEVWKTCLSIQNYLNNWIFTFKSNDCWKNWIVICMYLYNSSLPHLNFYICLFFIFKDSSRSGRRVSVSRIICHLTSQWHVDQWWLEEVGRTQFLEGLQRSGKGRKTIHNWANQFLNLYLNFKPRPSNFLSNHQHLIVHH